MEVIIHNQIEVLEQIIPRWEELKDGFYEITIFQEVNWIKNWWEHKKKSMKITPYIVEVRKNNRTIGIIPLYISEKGFANLRFRVLRPIGVDNSNYLLPILSKNHLPEKILQKAMDKINQDKASW